MLSVGRRRLLKRSATGFYSHIYGYKIDKRHKTQNDKWGRHLALGNRSQYENAHDRRTSFKIDSEH